MAIEKTCWTLAELAKEWECTEDDLLWLGVNGKLLFSVWCSGDGFIVHHSCNVPIYILGDASLPVECAPGFLEVPAFSISDLMKGHKSTISIAGFLSGEKIFIPVTPKHTEIPIAHGATKYIVESDGIRNIEVSRDDLKVTKKEFERYELENALKLVKANIHSNQEEDEVRTYEEIADVLGVSVGTVKNYIKKYHGSFPANRIGGLWRASKLALKKWNSPASWDERKANKKSKQ